MLRIEFTAEDIARTRVTATLGPFAETLLGLSALRTGHRERLAPAGRRGPDHRTGELARFLSPRPEVQVDLFTLTRAADEFDEAAEALLAAPDDSLAAEVAAVRCCHDPRDPAWLAGIEAGALPARRNLVDALERAHRYLVRPYWPAMRSILGAERARLQREFSDGGVHRMLSTFHPRARWRSGTLELPTAGRWSPRPLTSRLGGRGLVLVPSVLCPIGPVPYFPYRGDGPAIVFYPVPADLVAQSRWWTGLAGDPGSPLVALLGRTRAAVLEAVAEACTTTELARRLGISAASASQHATALRGAGLVTSRRDGNRMLHSLTRLGAALLDGQGAQQLPRPPGLPRLRGRP